MGLDPENPDYEIGINNPQCHVGLFGSETPKYVMAHFEGIVKCGPALPDPPNGAFLLTQRPGGTVWLDNVPLLTVRFELSIFVSQLTIGQFILGFPRLWFSNSTGVLCRTTFPNQEVCGVGFAAGEDGIAEIFWGPTIHT